jgi:hypothetical protein
VGADRTRGLVLLDLHISEGEGFPALTRLQCLKLGEQLLTALGDLEPVVEGSPGVSGDTSAPTEEHALLRRTEAMKRARH